MRSDRMTAPTPSPKYFRCLDRQRLLRPGSLLANLLPLSLEFSNQLLEIHSLLVSVDLLSIRRRSCLWRCDADNEPPAGHGDIRPSLSRCLISRPRRPDKT